MPASCARFRALVAPLGIACVGANELGLPEPEEIGVTFADNADLKAREAADLSGLPALADDSGLCVDALHGRPGIFSAAMGRGRVRQTGDWMRAMERVWREVEAEGPDAGHDAHFVCALAIAWPTTARPKPSKAASRARWSGRRVDRTASAMIRCSSPTAATQTFGEMDPDAKHRISHRADAFRKLVAALR